MVQEIPEVVGPLPPVEEFTEPMYSQVHQEQTAAGEMTEYIAEIEDSLVPPIVEETIEVLPRIPAHVDDFIADVPVATYDELCKILTSKQAELRQAKLAVQRLELYAAVSGHARDAGLVSEAKHAYNSGKMALGKIIREIDASRCC